MDDADLLSDARRRLPAARNAILRAVGDMPSRGGPEGVSGGGTGEWGPTVTIAMNCHRDHAYRDLGRLTEIEWANRTNGGITRHQLHDLCDLVDRWAPDPKRRQALEDGLRAAADGKGDDGCVSHARVKDHRGTPRYEERHPGLSVCQTCHRDLQRVRARDKFVDATLVPIVVVQWRERHAGKNLSDAILDRLLDSGSVA